MYENLKNLKNSKKTPKIWKPDNYIYYFYYYIAQVYSFFHINDLTLMFVFSFVLHFFDISIDLFISNSNNDVFYTTSIYKVTNNHKWCRKSPYYIKQNKHFYFGNT